MAYIVGITGGIGGGKTTVSRYLTELGATVIDTDAISHEVTRPGSVALQEIRKAFGGSVINKDGTLDRKALAGVVFTDKDKLALLNSIIHPKVRKRWLEEVANSKAPIVFVVIPLLFENNLSKHFNEIWVVTADEETRIIRVMDRDKVPREAVLQRAASQLPEPGKIASADIVINTTLGYEGTRAATETAFLELKRRIGLERA